MALDFEREYGVNAGYVQSLYEEWKRERSSVDETWQRLFEKLDGGGDGSVDDSESEDIVVEERESSVPAPARGHRETAAAGAGRASERGNTAVEAPPPARTASSTMRVKPPAAPPAPASAAPSARPASSPAAGPAAPAAPDSAAPAPAAPPTVDEPVLEPLAGVAGRIASHMTESLELPTATSVRTIPAKVLYENRAVLNEHMEVRALGKASFTHVVAFALARALAEMPQMLAAFVEQDGKPFKRVSQHVHLGLAIDVAGPKGRLLVVPSIKNADTLDFATFRAAYEDLVARARAGKLTPADSAGTNVTLTNPGGFGTEMSVPRLMKGQGLIVATGSIGVPPHMSLAAESTLALAGVGPVMTVTSTYDHRVIQGAESGLFLKRLEELLLGDGGFYDEIFATLRVPWKPYVHARDTGDPELEANEKRTKVWELVNAYRVRGCRIADLDPLEYKPDHLESLDPSSYGFTIWDLDRSFPSTGMLGKHEMTLREILAVLRRAYCRRWSIEYMHIVDRDEKWWIRDQVEVPSKQQPFTQDERMALLERLYRAENFERFLHTQYVGNKRFSLEGADSLIPALAEIIERAAERGVERVVIGMAHRGRLNVLANILGKSWEAIFQEFEGVLLTATEGSGDVKYHLGQKGVFATRTGKEVEVLLSPNPSHLEAVDPVVCGMTRAFQDEREDRERKSVLAVLIHGDAAFSGQGVVAETLEMSQLRAYANGGTVHFVINNQIGFTTGPRDLRSTYYCTDVAKSVQAPIMHANGDYPESVLRAARLAVDYQREFGADVVVDMVCYRRWGHNEGDEPAFTQPVLYAKIRKHPTVVETYTQLLQRRGVLDEAEVGAIRERFDSELAEARERLSGKPESAPLDPSSVIDLDDDDPADYADAERSSGVPTAIARETAVEIIDQTNRMPEGHVVHPNLLRQLRRREQMVRGELGVDWGCAEALAFGGLLRQGVSIRLAGQDTARGTFSQRHSVIRDQTTEKDHVPLKTVAREGATFDAWDSLLSEEAALGFEYGYSIARPEALVLWEAQYGDFVNGAQVPIDQFIAAGESKWREKSGVVLLLPHGYDGQGPEHSSARPERFLALCANGNITAANCTTSAQYFHLLRRQGLEREKRPLVVFTPKSLLREKRAASPIEDFATGSFQELIPDRASPAKVRRIVFSSGKVFYDLEAARGAGKGANAMLVRIEQLYPFPRQSVRALADAHPEAELVWAQEEPRNMGAWTFVMQRFADMHLAVSYAGRPQSPSPATGSYRRHVIEQEHLVERALGE